MKIYTDNETIEKAKNRLAEGRDYGYSGTQKYYYKLRGISKEGYLVFANNWCGGFDYKYMLYFNAKIMEHYKQDIIDRHNGEEITLDDIENAINNGAVSIWSFIVGVEVEFDYER